MNNCLICTYPPVEAHNCCFCIGLICNACLRSYSGVQCPNCKQRKNGESPYSRCRAYDSLRVVHFRQDVPNEEVRLTKALRLVVVELHRKKAELAKANAEHPQKEVEQESHGHGQGVAPADSHVRPDPTLPGAVPDEGDDNEADEEKELEKALSMSVAGEQFD